MAVVARWIRPGLVALLAAFCSLGARAESQAREFSPRIWLSPGIYSRHFDRAKHLRDDNLGFGVEVSLDEDHVLMTGSFINSNRQRSRYRAYLWRPLHWKYAGFDLAAGVLAAAFDGYPNYRGGAWFVAPLPALAIEGRRFGANVSVVPTIRNRLDGAIAVQFKVRIW